METLSIEFFHVFSWMWPQARGRVCSLQLTFERQEGRPAVSDLRQGFFPLQCNELNLGHPTLISRSLVMFTTKESGFGSF